MVSSEEFREHQRVHRQWRKQAEKAAYQARPEGCTCTNELRQCAIWCAWCWEVSNQLRDLEFPGGREP